MLASLQAVLTQAVKSPPRPHYHAATLAPESELPRHVPITSISQSVRLSSSTNATRAGFENLAALDGAPGSTSQQEPGFTTDLSLRDEESSVFDLLEYQGTDMGTWLGLDEIGWDWSQVAQGDLQA